MSTVQNIFTETVRIPAHGAELTGDLSIPTDAIGVVVFAHGSGSGRTSPRNQFVAGILHERKLATLLFDLLTPDEVSIDEVTRHLRFDIGFLATRLVAAVDWTTTNAAIAHLPLGLFGASTGAAAALVAAAARPAQVSAIVSRGGRPDLALKILDQVLAPTMLIVGGEDAEVIGLNERAFHRLSCVKEMVLVNRATHLFEEPGTLEEMSRLAVGWFARHLVWPSVAAGRAEPEAIDEIC